MKANISKQLALRRLRAAAKEILTGIFERCDHGMEQHEEYVEAVLHVIQEETFKTVDSLTAPEADLKDKRAFVNRALATAMELADKELMLVTAITASLKQSVASARLMENFVDPTPAARFVRAYLTNVRELTGKLKYANPHKRSWRDVAHQASLRAHNQPSGMH